MRGLVSGGGGGDRFGGRGDNFGGWWIKALQSILFHDDGTFHDGVRGHLS